MLQKIKSEYQDIKGGEPGHRFTEHHKNSRQSARGSSWRTVGYLAAGLILIICGFVLSLPPGVPGFLLWIPGLALLAVCSRTFARLLDRLEVWGRQIWRRLRPRTDT